MTLPATQFLKDHFNDPDGVIGLLDKHRPASPKRMAVVKWFERNSIPGEWWPELLMALFDENGRWPDLFAYDATPDNDLFS
jgi:hypothetical protein